MVAFVFIVVGLWLVWRALRRGRAYA
jgi:hypothetical protein